MQVKPDKSIASRIHDSLRDLKRSLTEYEAMYLLTLWGHSSEEAERIVKEEISKNASEAK